MYIDSNFVETMFKHYIERKKYNQDCAPGSEGEIWSGGEISEAEKWLKQLGIDLSYVRIQPMVNGNAPIKAYD